jgi:hypothetical protein
MEKQQESLQSGEVPPQLNYVQPGQPLMYGQQPPPYGQPQGQPQPVYTQEYPSQPQYVQHGQPLAGPSTVVVVQAPAAAPARTDWTMPQAKISSILMIVGAILNFITFISFGITTNSFDAEFVIAFLIYIVTGILGVVAAVRKQTTQGRVIACLVMAIISTVMAFVQVSDIIVQLRK